MNPSMTNGVFVIVSCPAVDNLRKYIYQKEFADEVIDDWVKKSTSILMEEMITAVIEHNVEFDKVYEIFIDDILQHLSNFVTVIAINSVSCWYDDTIVLHCSPIGVKNGHSC